MPPADSRESIRGSKGTTGAFCIGEMPKMPENESRNFYVEFEDPCTLAIGPLARPLRLPSSLALSGFAWK